MEDVPQFVQLSYEQYRKMYPTVTSEILAEQTEDLVSSSAKEPSNTVVPAYCINCGALLTSCTCDKCGTTFPDYLF